MTTLSGEIIRENQHFQFNIAEIFMFLKNFLMIIS